MGNAADASSAWETGTQRSSEAPDSGGGSLTSGRSGLYVVARLADVGPGGRAGQRRPQRDHQRDFC